MPNGPTEYWFTELVFEVGDKFERAGETWVVTSIGETDQANGKHVSVTVRRDEAPPKLPRTRKALAHPRRTPGSPRAGSSGLVSSSQAAGRIVLARTGEGHESPGMS